MKYEQIDGIHVPTSQLHEPWVESDLYNEYRKNRENSPYINIADQYHKNGFIILKRVIGEEFIHQVIEDTRPLLEGKNKYGRVQDAWKKVESVRQVAINQKVIRLIEFLYGRKAIPFQTLNFEFGTQQPAHSDTIHFSCIPARFMCGAWVALDDIEHDNGPLFYYPGSHNLKEYKLHDMGIVPNLSSSYPEYEKYIQRLMDIMGFEKKELLVEKGDVLIWASNLIHGGSIQTNRNKTRWSQVTHYYFENCFYYTPFFSNEIVGEYALKRIINIHTGQTVPNIFNGKEVKTEKVAKNIFRIQ